MTLGCARNDVDSEELAGRLEAGGFRLVDEPADAETVVVNTCGFVDAAKKDSVDTLLAAADLKETGATKSVVAVGCLAERYGAELAESLPEADAVLGFDDYPDIAGRLHSILAGDRHQPHTPQDRRLLLPISPVARDRDHVVVPGHARARPARWGWPPSRARDRCGVASTVGRWRRSSWPAAVTGGARSARSPRSAARSSRGGRSTCWRRRGGWPSGGVRELFLVSENSTSYGKDLGDLRLLETCCRSWRPSTGSSGCGSPTCSPRRPGPA